MGTGLVLAAHKKERTRFSAVAGSFTLLITTIWPVASMAGMHRDGDGPGVSIPIT